MSGTQAFKEYLNWSQNPAFDAKTRKELEGIADDKAEIEDRFYQDLKFGTAGLRGVMGAGTNRMNRYTVARAATGFAKDLLDKNTGDKVPSVAISYDSRNNSRFFAELAARILISYGLEVYFSDELRPVPMLSFAIRHYQCDGGIMITASHNPKKYNGFKVYAQDGAQLGPEAAERVAVQMRKLTDLPELIAGLASFEEASKSELWHYMADDLDQAYDKMLLEIAMNKEAVANQADMPIVYTPLYGTGNKPVRRILKKLGFKNVHVVEEQEQPNGNFPSTPFPNPELPEVFAEAIKLAKEIDAPLAMATDPDADRVGIAVRRSDGEYETLLGNDIGILLMEYILDTRKKQGTMPEKPFVVSSIVSSRLPDRISKEYDTALYRVLTGFKFIAQAIHEHEDLGDEEFIFGYEEAFGYLAGSSVRDKDAVVSCMLLAEMAAVAAEAGETILDRLERIHKKYGYTAETTISIVREGKSGQELIAATMDDLRQDPFKDFAAVEIEKLCDFDRLLELDLDSGEEKTLDYSQSNVMLYELSGIDFFCIRPSGTEPKIKIYFGCYAKSQAECDVKLEKLKDIVLARIEKLMEN